MTQFKKIYYKFSWLLLNPLNVIAFIVIYSFLMGWVIGSTSTIVECSNNDDGTLEISKSQTPSSILALLAGNSSSSIILGFLGGATIVSSLLLLGGRPHSFLINDISRLKEKYTWQYLDDLSADLVNRVNFILAQKNEGIETGLIEKELIDLLILTRGELANYCNYCLMDNNHASSFTCMSSELLTRINMYIGLFVTDVTVPPLYLDSQLVLRKDTLLNAQLQIQHTLNSRGEHIPLLADKMNLTDLEYCLEKNHSTWFGHDEYSLQQIEYSLNYVHQKVKAQNKIEYGYQSKHSYLEMVEPSTSTVPTSTISVLGENPELVFLLGGTTLVFGYYCWKFYQSKSK